MRPWSNILSCSVLLAVVSFKPVLKGIFVEDGHLKDGEQHLAYQGKASGHLSVSLQNRSEILGEVAFLPEDKVGKLLQVCLGVFPALEFQAFFQHQLVVTPSACSDCKSTECILQARTWR